MVDIVTPEMVSEAVELVIAAATLVVAFFSVLFVGRA
jgi:hypothetical protein